MSSWDRSRRLPWSKIDQGNADPEQYRERVYRQIQREMNQDDSRQKEQQGTDINNGSDGHNSASSLTKSGSQEGSFLKHPFSGMEMFKHFAFGGCLGSITGVMFGFMDGMRQAGESPVIKRASNSAKAKFLFQGATRSGAMFGAFFGGFHTVKYGVKLIADPGDYGEIGIAGVISMGALVVKPATRASIPYAGMLVVMDGFSRFMRDS